MCVIGCMILTGAKETQGVDLKTWIETVKRVGPEGKGHEAAIQAMSMLSKQPADSIPQLLEGMNGANRLAVNWLRSAVEFLHCQTCLQRHGGLVALGGGLATL